MRLLLVLSLLSCSAVAHAGEAGSRVLLWGFQRGGEAVPDLDRYVQRELEAGGFPGVTRLDPSAPVNKCQGPSAGAQVRRACPGVPGNVRILGGQIEALKPPQNRARLWLYDTATGKTAWLDTYCQSCMQASLLSRNAIALLSAPDWSAAASAQPSYCLQSSAQDAAGRPPAEACAPWPELACEDSAAPSSDAAAPHVGIDPKLAKIIKGSLWTLFGVSAATGVALTVVNGTDIATAPGREHTLGDAAWTAIGLSAATLAVTIPLHVLISRAQKAPARPSTTTTPAAAETPALLRCPR